MKMHNRALSFRTVSARLRKNNNQPARCFLRTKEAGKPLTRLWSGVAMFPLVVSFFFLSSVFFFFFSFSSSSFFEEHGKHLFLVVKLSEKLVCVVLVTPCNTGDG